MQAKRRPSPGIEERHSRICRSSEGGKCNCQPSYRAWIFDPQSGTKVRKTFPTLAAAKRWRVDATSAKNRGRLVTTTRVTLNELAEQWLEGAQAEPPTVLNRSNEPYKPSALREVERNLRNYVLPALGAHRLSDVRRGDLQRFVDKLRGEGLSGSKVRNVIIALRVLYRHAIERELVEFNPTSGLRLPNGSKPRERAASAGEARELLAALPESDRALWATAFYAGLRRGELRGLRWSDVDLAKGVISIRRSWDDVAGEVAPKSSKGTRTVPVVALLRDYLLAEKLRTGRDGGDLVFGAKPDHPFTPSHIRKRAAKAWETESTKRKAKKLPPLVPIGLHECRHTYVSLLHDAGLSLERIGDYVGHSSAYMTDRYRHLLDGHEAEAAELLDRYLAASVTSEEQVVRELSASGKDKR